MLLFIFLMLLCFGVVFYLLRPTKTETAVQQQLEQIKESRSEAAGQTILRSEGYSSNLDISLIVRQVPGAPETLNLIRQAGVNWMVAPVMGISIVSTVLTAWIASLFISSVLLAVVVGIIAGIIPYVSLLILREQRFRKCDQLLPEAIDLMARGLRAGHALTAVIEMVGSEIADPIKTEFTRLHEEHSLGLSLRDATMNLVERLPRDDVRFLATAILLQKETGGNLAIILDKTSAVARERARLRGQLMIYTAQGRVTGWILCIMPFFMFGVLSMLNWNTEKILFTDEMGLHAVYWGLFLMVLGILTIRKIIDIKV